MSNIWKKKEVVPFSELFCDYEFLPTTSCQALAAACDFCFPLVLFRYLATSKPIQDVLRTQIQGPEGYGVAHRILLLRRSVFVFDLGVCVAVWAETFVREECVGGYFYCYLRINYYFRVFIISSV